MSFNTNLSAATSQVATALNNVYSLGKTELDISIGKAIEYLLDTVTSLSGDSLTETATVELTNAQIKALHTTPITIVAAKGANQFIEFESAVLKLNHGGTNDFTEDGGGGGSNLTFFIDGDTDVDLAIVDGTGFIDASADAICVVPNQYTSATVDLNHLASNSLNKALKIKSAAAIDGNAGADNTITVHVQYKVHDFS